MLHLGFGILFAAYLMAIGHAGGAGLLGDRTDVFFAGCSLGMVVAGVVAVAFALTARRARFWTSLAGNGVVIVVALACSISGLMSQLQIGSASLGSVGSSMPDCLPDSMLLGLMESVPGIAFGVGCFLLMLVWTKIYSTFSFVDAFRKGSLSLLLGILLAAVGQWLAKGMPTVLYVVVLLVIAASCALILQMNSGNRDTACGEDACGHSSEKVHVEGKREAGGRESLGGCCGSECSHRQGAFDCSGDRAEALGKRYRLVALLRPSWASLCGLGICAFLLGLLWAQEAPQTSEIGSFWTNVGFVGPFLFVGAMAYVSRRLHEYAQVKRFFWVVMPVVAALFVITPLFDDVGSAGWNALVMNLQNGGSAALVVCTWSLLLASSRAAGISTSAAFGGCFAFVAALSLVGFALYRLVGAAANVVAIVMFVAYLCATVVFLAMDGSEEPTARKQESNIVESYIESRCKTIVDAYALTPRETEMLALLSRGHSYGFIAESLYISEATVRTHARNIYRKIGISSQEDLLNYVDSL